VRILFLLLLVFLWIAAEYVFWVLFKSFFQRSLYRTLFTILWFGLPLLGFFWMLTRHPATDFSTKLIGNLVVWFALSKAMAMLFLSLAYVGHAIYSWASHSNALPGRRIFLRNFSVAAIGLPMLAGIWGLLVTASEFKIHRVKIKSPRIPNSFKGFKIVQLSDLHTGSMLQYSTMQKLINTVAELKPDLILFTGDLVNNLANEAYPYKKLLSQFNATHGVYSVLGNHDYGDYVKWNSPADKQANFQSMIQLHHELGWTLLRNAHTYIQINNEKIALAGVENWGAKLHFQRHGDLNAATKGIEAQTYTLLMSHDPSHWEAEILDLSHQIDLTLSGHTHGFQFGIEVPGFKWSPVQYVYTQWAGLYYKGDKFLYVNRGTGCIGYSGRIGISPEVTLIELG
jgi:predicted MPP superfamily phosphohydrolase